MQDFADLSGENKTKMLNSMKEGAQYQLKDKRDDKTYTISKLKDGNVWMTENLRLGKTDSTMQLTSDDTDLAKGATFNLPAHVSSWTSTYTAPMIHVSDDKNTLGYYGYYYNYYAATAGTVKNTKVNATASICPKGWTLPDNYSQTQDQSYPNLLMKHGILSSATSSYTTGGYDKLASTPLNFVLSGYHASSGTNVAYRDSVGSYWTGTSSSSTATIAYELYFGNTFIYPQDSFGKDTGCAIRCMMTP